MGTFICPMGSYVGPSNYYKDPGWFKIGLWVSVKFYGGLSGYEDNLMGSLGLMKS